MTEKESYREVPQNEPAEPEMKKGDSGGGVRLEAKMSLMNGKSSNNDMIACFLNL